MVSNFRSAAEVRADHISTLGEDLGEVYNELQGELLWLHVKWDQYVSLYGTKPERVDLLNEAAGLFFRVLQDTLWEDILLHISRVTDPAQSAGKANLSVQRIPGLIQDAGLKDRVEKLVASAVEKAKFAKAWRNRHIAHLDLALALKKPTIPLPPSSRLHVRDALEALREVLNAIDGHYWSSEMAYEQQSHFGDAVALLHVIRDGIEAERARRKRFEEHRLLPEDLQSLPAV